MAGPVRIDQTGAPVNFRPQTFEVVRYCARRKVEETDVDDEGLDPFHVRVGAVGSVPWGHHARRDMGDATDMDDEKGNCSSSTGTRRSEGRYRPAAVPVLDSPTLAVQLLFSPRFLVRHPEWESFCDKKCETSRAPVLGWAR